MEISEDTFNRLKIGLIEKFNCSEKEADKKLEDLKINLLCSEKIKISLPLQAALLTAINTGERAFLGGVYLSLPFDTPCLVPWPEKKSLNQICLDLGAKIVDDLIPDTPTLTFGLSANIDENSLQVVCNDWRGGVLNGDEVFPFEETGKLPLGGILAGSLGICLFFLKQTEIDITAGDKSCGLSLWDTNKDWLNSDEKIPDIENLPKKFWLLGLGHLGQAYLWSIGLLPYKNTNEVNIFLQDFDKIVEANFSSGLLSGKENIEYKKTRVCSNWIESRGFQSTIIEKKFDKHTKRVDDEPFLALCGFDSAIYRAMLEDAGFDLIIEAGLGDGHINFDNISIHTFPNASKSAFDTWKTQYDESEIKKNVLEQLKKTNDNNDCGIIKIAGKAFSASFVGAFTSSIIIAESIKALHQGNRTEKLVIHMRDINNKTFIESKKQKYDTELSKNGYIKIC